MKTIWIIGQAGPIEGENWRDYRYNQFGKYLSQECGYRVIWWTSNFSHHFKQYRSEGWKDIEVAPHYTIRLVPSSSYRKNFSIGRFRCIGSFAKNTGRGFQKEEPPDVIIGNCVMTKGYPIFPYAQKHHIPIIVDQGDIWPEFIEKSMGRFAKAGHLLFAPLYRSRCRNYARADGLMALGRNYLEFARNVAPNGHEKPCALVYNGIDIARFREMAAAELSPALSAKVDRQEGELLAVFAGTFGPSYDIEAMLECAKRFKQNHVAVKLVLAGSGPRVPEVEKAAAEYDNIVYVGALKPTELIPLYTVCDVGLCAYTAKSNVDMPDKFYDYTAAGLAVVNSLTQEVAEYVRKDNIGLNYTASDVDDLYAKIGTIASDRELLAQMKANARALSGVFDAKVQNAKLAALIDELLQQ